MSSDAVVANIFFNLKFPIVDKIEFSELEKIKNDILLKINGYKGLGEIL